MYVLIDKEKMCVCFKHADAKVLSDLVHIEWPHRSGCVLPCEETDRFKEFSDMELRILYKNLAGTHYPSMMRHGLEANIVTLLKSLPESTLNANEIKAQADCIAATDLKYYQYKPGASKPLEVEEPSKLNLLQAAQGFTPTIPPPPPVNAAPTPVAAPRNPLLQTPAPRTPAAPRPPRDPNAPPVSAEAPKGGSQTGRVWEIAEKIWLEAGKPDPKEIRKQIIATCEAEGINSSTASVQFGKWRAGK